eukprot:13575402-Ditylum_brightwellii.AAC.1
MSYTRGHHVEIWIDQKNPTAWYNNTTSNWQWTPAVFTHYLDTSHSVTCIMASHPYQTPPTLPVFGRQQRHSTWLMSGQLRWIRGQ